MSDHYGVVDVAHHAQLWPVRDDQHGGFDCVHGGAGDGGFMPAGFEVVVTDDDVDIAASVCLCGEFAPTHLHSEGDERHGNINEGTPAALGV